MLKLFIWTEQISNWPTTQTGDWGSGLIQRFQTKVAYKLWQQVGEGWEGLTIQNSPHHWRPWCSNMTSLSDLVGNVCS